MSVVLDRENACAMLIISTKGGMGIEEVSKEFIMQKRIDLVKGITV